MLSPTDDPRETFSGSPGRSDIAGIAIHRPRQSRHFTPGDAQEAESHQVDPKGIHPNDFSRQRVSESSTLTFGVVSLLGTSNLHSWMQPWLLVGETPLTANLERCRIPELSDHLATLDE